MAYPKQVNKFLLCVFIVYSFGKSNKKTDNCFGQSYKKAKQCMYIFIIESLYLYNQYFLYFVYLYWHPSGATLDCMADLTIFLWPFAFQAFARRCVVAVTPSASILRPTQKHVMQGGDWFRLLMQFVKVEICVWALNYLTLVICSGCSALFLYYKHCQSIRILLSYPISPRLSQIKAWYDQWSVVVLVDIESFSLKSAASTKW